MRTAFALRVATFLLCASVAAACGDIYADPITSSTSPSVSRGSIADASASSPQDRIASCPHGPAVEGAACDRPGVTCEYGSSPDMHCNTTLACVLDESFGATWAARPSALCPSYECPTGPAATIDGSPCAVPSVEGGVPADSDELVCPMTDAICTCTTGADATHAHTRRWICVKPPATCPSTRPLAGQSCSGARVCDYGSCAFKRGMRMECKLGVWLSGERDMQLSRLRARPLVVLGAAAVAFVAACTTTTSIGTGSFGGSASAPSPPESASLPSTSPDCPQVPPSVGEGCDIGVCEYGGAADPACNVVARCESSSWTLDEPHCPTTCPMHFDERVPSETCSEPELCTYLEATCGCAGAITDAWTQVTSASAADAGNAADGGTEASAPDSGAAAAPEGHWQCVRPGNGCPARRPVPGARCGKRITCDYGTCVFGVPLTMKCDGSSWTTLTDQACP